jgi:DNA-binding NarL/FixJ family response regulator
VDDPPLREALQRAQGHGLALHAAAAQRELSAAGGRRRRAVEDRDELTPAQQRVAELAADGLTNAEIAGRLYVSVNTVETHLRRIYSKLGIHSRRGLMRAGRPGVRAEARR